MSCGNCGPGMTCDRCRTPHGDGDLAELDRRLKEMSAAATPGLWGAEPKRLTIPLANGEWAQGPLMSYLKGDGTTKPFMTVSLGSERHADHHFVVALVNAYRSGALTVAQSEKESMIYSAAERIEGGKVKLHLAPPPIWDGRVTFDSECVINGYHVPAGTTWHVILRSEVK
jgi:hypothetical protein